VFVFVALFCVFVFVSLVCGNDNCGVVSVLLANPNKLAT